MVNPLTRFASSKPVMRPVVLNLDFEETQKKYDIDGDGIADFDHSQLIEKIIKGRCPSADVIAFRTKDESLTGISKLVQQAVAYTKAHPEVKAVNISLGTQAQLEDIQMVEPDVDQSSIGALKHRLVGALKQLLPNNIEPLTQVLTGLRQLIDTGVSLYVCGGNVGQGGINLLNLIEGGNHVGAHGADGKAMPFSADNTLLNRQGKGVFISRRVADGYDLNDDGKADVGFDEVSGHKPAKNWAVGKDLNDILAKPDEMSVFKSLFFGVEKGSDPQAAQKLIDSKLFRIQDFQALGLLDAEAAQTELSLGNYGMFYPLGILGGFRSQSGKIIFDPDRTPFSGPSNKPQGEAVSYFYGTSFSSPDILAQDLQRQMTS